METKKVDVQESCCACEQNMEEQVNKLVDEVEGYSDQDRREKKEELQEAFAKEEK